LGTRVLVGVAEGRGVDVFCGVRVAPAVAVLVLVGVTLVVGLTVSVGTAVSVGAAVTSTVPSLVVAAIGSCAKSHKPLVLPTTRLLSPVALPWKRIVARTPLPLTAGDGLRRVKS
jgi:hypothetical protein